MWQWLLRPFTDGRVTSHTETETLRQSANAQRHALDETPAVEALSPEPSASPSFQSLVEPLLERLTSLESLVQGLPESVGEAQRNAHRVEQRLSRALQQLSQQGLSVPLGSRSQQENGSSEEPESPVPTSEESAQVPLLQAGRRYRPSPE